MCARDVMSEPVVVVRPAIPIRAAAALLASHGFAGAPVVDPDRHVIGMVTEADLLRGRIPPTGWPGHVHRTAARDRRGGHDPYTVRAPDSDLADVVTLMLDANIRSIPIADDGRLVGIVTRRDVLRVVAYGEVTSREVLGRRARQRDGDRGEPASVAAGAPRS